MTTSAAVIITDGEKLLAINPWGKPGSLDIPKGGIEEGESPGKAAVREVREEAGIDIIPVTLKDLGVTPYNQYKNLHVFLYLTDDLPKIKDMFCSSYFTNEAGKEVPEAVGYEYVLPTDKRFYFSLKPILQRIFSNI